MKVNELRDKSIDELNSRERELREQLFKLRFQRATGQLENTSRLREARRDIARIKTIAGQKRRAESKKA